MFRTTTISRPSTRALAAVGLAVAALLTAGAVAFGPQISDRPVGATSGSGDLAVPGDAAGGAIVSPGSQLDPSVDAAVRSEPGFGAADAGRVIEGDQATSETTDAVGAAKAPVASGGLAAPSIDARIVRTGTVELRVRRGSFESAWGDVQALAGANGGIVTAASRSGAGRGSRTGTVTMRVPTARFDRVVDALRGVDRTSVRSLDVASQDVSEEFVDVRSRLRHDRAVEARLLALLADTTRVGEVLAVQARLDGVQEQIEVSAGRLRYLEAMTSMSTVQVGLTQRARSGADERDEPSALRASLGEAGDRLLASVTGAIVWLGGALPALVLLAVGALVARRVWRRSSRHAGSAQE